MTTVTTPLMPGSLTDEALLDGDVGRGVAYHVHAILRQRGDTRRIVFRGTCLQCGASAQESAELPEGVTQEMLTGQLDTWGEQYADTHDARTCLDTFTAGTVSRITEVLTKVISDEVAQLTAAGVIEAIQDLALDAEGTDWVVLAGQRGGPEKIPAGDAALAASHYSSHATLAAHSALLEEAVARLGGDVCLAVVTLDGADLGVGVRRWYLLTPTRLIPFETKVVNGQIEVTAGSDPYESTDARFKINPYRALTVAKLAAV